VLATHTLRELLHKRREIGPTDRPSGEIRYWPLSDGEVHAFYWFMQGSIMVPETRHRLWAAWGFCERHAWGHLAVEAAFRPGHLMGPCILYVDLVERMLRCASHRRLGRCLDTRSACIMCEMNVYTAGAGAAPASRLARGRDVESIRRLATETREHWQDTVCGACRGDDTGIWCRRHLLAQYRSLPPSLVAEQFRRLAEIYERLSIYDRSFAWDTRFVPSPADRAALFSAIGWLGGWRPLLALFDNGDEGGKKRMP
jgi:hypothetical protein